MTMTMTMTTTTKTTRIMVTTMKKTTTKQQPTVGNNSLGVWDDGGKSRGRQIGGVF
jgi:hypothetical protein